MEPAVNTVSLLAAAPRGQRYRVLFARVFQVLGWAGLGGVVLLLVAAVIAEGAWLTNRALAADAAVAKAVVRKGAPSGDDAKALPVVTAPKLPLPADVPLLILRIERAALAAGLPWNAAEYRMLPATETKAGSLEVHASFKAPYPKLRAMVADVLASVPASSFRELSFARPTADTPDVEAKITIAVYLADSPATLARKRAP